METKVCKCCGRELPISNFTKASFGYLYTCHECVTKKQKDAKEKKKLERAKIDELEKAKESKLSDYTPRELMTELKRRGYEFTMKYTQVHIIKSDEL